MIVVLKDLKVQIYPLYSFIRKLFLKHLLKADIGPRTGDTIVKCAGVASALKLLIVLSGPETSELVTAKRT